MPDEGTGGAGSETRGQPIPRTLTPADHGRVYVMQVGQTTSLIVPDPYAPDPDVRGTSVEVVEVVNVDASGRREWELRALKPGRTTLQAKGTRPYTIHLDVDLNPTPR
jgi:predicted secreted protein